jgi:hypothetical protein
MAFYIKDKNIINIVSKRESIKLIVDFINNVTGNPRETVVELRYVGTPDEVILIQVDSRSRAFGPSNIVMIQDDEVCINPLSNPQTKDSRSEELRNYIESTIPSILRDQKLTNILNDNL